MVDVVAELEHLKKLAEQDPTNVSTGCIACYGKPDLLALARERIARNKGAQTPAWMGK